MSDVSFSESEEEFDFEEDPIDAFEACAEANDWKCNREVANQCCIVAENGSVSLPVSAQWDEEQETVLMAIAFELECPREKIPELCVHLLEVSEPMRLGSFFYQAEYGLLIWKYCLTLAGVPGIMPDQVVDMIEYGMAQFSQHLAKILKLAEVEESKDVLTLLSTYVPTSGRMN